MSLQFILGGSGSGKTRTLYENLIRMSIEEADVRYFVIVPEQATMQAQKEIVSLHPRHGVMNVDIVSFERLAYRVFEELSVISLEVLDDMGKSMVLRKVAALNKKDLSLYKELLNKNGFIGQLKSMLSELYQYGITPTMLDEQIAKAESHVLSQKLTDISVIYKGFQTYIEEKFITSEEILNMLCKKLPDSQLIKGSVVVLDGYTGFTPVQYRLLEQMLHDCKKVIVTVSIDPGASVLPEEEQGKQELFYMSRAMVRKLDLMALNGGIDRDADVRLLEHPAVRYTSGEAVRYDLDFLEQNLYRFSGNHYETAPESIRIYQTLNPAEEIAMVGGQIQEYIRGKDCRYRDVAVITGDLAGYSNELIHRFEASGIPYFLDDKKSIIKNPMVEFIRAALAVIVKDFDYESVFRYLKTGLAVENGEKEDPPRSSEKESMDRMENYVIALGIRGFKRWNAPWEYGYRGGKEVNLEELNAFRERLLAPLARLREAFRAEGANVLTMTRALTVLLLECRIKEKMMQWETDFAARGEILLSREYGQVYPMVLELFRRLVRLLGNEVISKKEYGEILDAGFGELKVGLIPSTADRVVVGDITRTRLDHIKVLFFVGVNDGIVPVKKENNSLFSDREREILEKQHIELAPTAKEEGFRQRFYLYLALTKPERKLVLSYPVMDASGAGKRPSALIREMKKMFPKLAVTVWDKETAVPFSLKDGKRRLADGLRALSYEAVGPEKEGQILELLRVFLSDPRYEQDVKRLVDGAFYAYEKHGIGKAAALALYGSVLSTSVTRMEQFASCAYAHFLSYGLELVKRQEFELAAMDMGNLFHDSIDLCFSKMKEQNGDWNSISEEDRKALVHECVQSVTEEYGNTILKSSARNAYLVGRVERITDRTIWALAEQLKKGDFTPVGFEVSFSAQDNLKAMKIPLSDLAELESPPHESSAEWESPPHVGSAELEALHLRGRIDRLDTCEEDGKIYVKIIDYKTGSTTFDLTALYHGLQLQLVVYMDAALEMEERKHPQKEVVPAGIFYYNINDPLMEKSGDLTKEEIDRQILKSLKMNGLVNSGLDAIRHLDRDIEKESDVIPVALKDGIIQEAKSSVAGTGRFAALTSYVHEKLRTEGREILDGNVDLNPYKQGIRSACDYCPYHAVCGFDLKTTGHGFRRFKSMKSDEIWPVIESPPHESSAESESPPHISSAESEEQNKINEEGGIGHGI